MLSKQILHYPNLKTVLEVEALLKNAEKPMTRYQILKNLNNKVMKQTLNVIVDYLAEKGIIVDGPKGILWTFQAREKLQRRVSMGLEV